MKAGEPVPTTRAIQCLYPLEVEAGVIDADFSEKPSLFGDYITSAGDLWKASSMGGVLNNTTPQVADESAGPRDRDSPLRLIRPRTEISVPQSSEGADELPMTADEVKAHRRKMTETDVGRPFDMIEGVWAQDALGN
jgi:hypothetical protein